MNIVLNAFEYVQVATNRMTGEQRTQEKQQKPKLDVVLELFAGPEDKPVNLGTQQYVFIDKAQRPTPGNKGLPEMNQVLPESVVSDWLDVLAEVIDEKVPYFVDDSVESREIGGEFHHRINSISISLPADKPELHVIEAMASVYMDEAFTQQLTTSQVNIRFASDEYVERMYRQLSQGLEPTAAELARFRADNNIFSLAEFVSKPGVVAGVVTVGQQFYTTLKTNVNQYANIDVAKVMARFLETVQKLFPVAS